MDTRARLRLGVAALAGAVVVVGAVLAVTRPWERPSCPKVAEHPGWSVARRWDEALLDAIRRSLPNPPVHARNLFHVSVAMWDAWAAYDATASGYVYKEKVAAPDIPAARNEAISYAAYRILSARFIKAVGADKSLSEFDDLMDALCFPISTTRADGDSPAAIGNRIARTVLDYAKTDGANEVNGYAAPDYTPVNPPLVVAKAGITLVDPNRWQPLQIERMVSQNGILITNGVQQAVAPHWGHVTPFAIPAGGASGTPFDPGPQPRFGDPATDSVYRAQAVEVIRDSALLDASNNALLDVSPAWVGGNALGSNDGRGLSQNPVTRTPYASDVVRAGDYYRAVVEFWADGPASETPPGHWNVIANDVSDELAPNLRIGGNGRAVDRLQWDVKLYLALNGGVHDAAIAAWGLKGRYDGVRPISMIRYMASIGQLSLVPGLIELITKEATASGAPMAALAGHEGEIAVRAWQGNPADPKTQTSPVTWILGTAWIPFQLPTFVTPSFQGYVSGHSTFSRAAAEVLTGITGSEYFPGGLSESTVKPGSFRIEAGPSAVVRLQWATYYDAADQAGQSRLYGGIHVQADDFTGRIVGATCGKDAWALAQRYYAGR
ncbi:MAG: vanadium-dependent haloperoxidase [Chloroflexota bacterium]